MLIYLYICKCIYMQITVLTSIHIHIHIYNVLVINCYHCLCQFAICCGKHFYLFFYALAFRFVFLFFSNFTTSIRQAFHVVIFAGMPLSHSPSLIYASNLCRSATAYVCVWQCVWHVCAWWRRVIFNHNYDIV